MICSDSNVSFVLLNLNHPFKKTYETFTSGLHATMHAISLHSSINHGIIKWGGAWHQIFLNLWTNFAKLLLPPLDFMTFTLCSFPKRLQYQFFQKPLKFSINCQSVESGIILHA